MPLEQGTYFKMQTLLVACYKLLKVMQNLYFKQGAL